MTVLAAAVGPGEGVAGPGGGARPPGAPVLPTEKRLLCGKFENIISKTHAIFTYNKKKEKLLSLFMQKFNIKLFMQSLTLSLMLSLYYVFYYLKRRDGVAANLTNHVRWLCVPRPRTNGWDMTSWTTEREQFCVNSSTEQTIKYFSDSLVTTSRHKIFFNHPPSGVKVCKCLNFIKGILSGC